MAAARQVTPDTPSRAHLQLHLGPVVLEGVGLIRGGSGGRGGPTHSLHRPRPRRRAARRRCGAAGPPGAAVSGQRAGCGGRAGRQGRGRARRLARGQRGSGGAGGAAGARGGPPRGRAGRGQELHQPPKVVESELVQHVPQAQQVLLQRPCQRLLRAAHGVRVQRDAVVVQRRLQRPQPRPRGQQQARLQAVAQLAQVLAQAVKGARLGGQLRRQHAQHAGPPPLLHHAPVLPHQRVRRVVAHHCGAQEEGGGGRQGSGDVGRRAVLGGWSLGGGPLLAADRLAGPGQRQPPIP
jgi:hypothetical protein